MPLNIAKESASGKKKLWVSLPEATMRGEKRKASSPARIEDTKKHKSLPEGALLCCANHSEKAWRTHKRKQRSPSPSEELALVTKKRKSMPALGQKRKVKSYKDAPRRRWSAPASTSQAREVDATQILGNERRQTPVVHTPAVGQEKAGRKRLENQHNPAKKGTAPTTPGADHLPRPSKTSDQHNIRKVADEKRPFAGGKQGTGAPGMPVRQQFCTDEGAERFFRDMGVHVFSLGEVQQMIGAESETVGKGSYSSCCKGRDPRTQREVVIKSFERDAMGNLTVETKKLHALQDTGVQRLVGVCVETRQLITEFAGVTLETYLGKSPPFADKVSVLLQVSQTLKRVSEKGFTHNDIKGDNICVCVGTNGPVATVIDFGVARPVGTLKIYRPTTETHAFPWIAPELLLQTHPCSEASDVYALARLMLRMLCVAARPLNPSMTALSSLIASARSPSPEQRPSLAGLIEALEDLVEHEET